MNKNKNIIGANRRSFLKNSGIALIGSPKNNMYQTEHDELFASIRNGKPMNDGEWMANSTMLGIWARMAGYTGQTISWEQAINSNEILGPKTEDHTWDLKWKGPPIAKPGITKFS